MKALIALGIALMLVGGGLMLKGSYTVKQKHEANILGAEISVTEEDRKPIPLALSGTLLGVGAVLVIVGAVKSRSR